MVLPEETSSLGTRDRRQGISNKYMQNELGYRGLEVYKKANELVLYIYRVTKITQRMSYLV